MARKCFRGLVFGGSLLGQKGDMYQVKELGP